MTPTDDDVLVRVEGLRKRFDSRRLLSRAGPSVLAVDGVDLTIRRGETFGVVGETGSGKSTLGRLILRLLEPTEGRIVFDGQDITGLSRHRLRAVRRQMQMVFQDPYGSLDPRMRVGDIIAEPMKVHNLGAREIAPRTVRIMEQVGLAPQMAARYPHEFSGGQRQRIGIARAMALDPQLLVLDEPVSALDVSIQAQILNLLAGLQRQTGVTCLFIAHDLAVVRHISDRIAVMYLGRIVEQAPAAQLYLTPRHPYTAALLSAVPVADLRRERSRRRIALHGEIGSATAMPSGCRFHPRCFKARLLAARGAVELAEGVGGLRLPAACVRHDPTLARSGSDAHLAACHYPLSDGEVETGAATATAT